jgi:hypothetical protein
MQLKDFTTMYEEETNLLGGYEEEILI